MKSIVLIEKLREKVVFNISDIERLTRSNHKYSKLILNRLKKANLIKKITKNVYTTNTNPYIISCHIKTPSYISLWSASSFLGYTDQMPKIIHIISPVRAKEINFNNYKISFIRLNKFFGYKKVKTKEGELFIAENEKLLIDAFLKYKEMGNFDEILNIIKNAEISKEKLIVYLKKINNQSVTKKIGYSLEKERAIDISKQFKFDNNYVILNPFEKKWEGINAKWRVKI